MSKIFSKICIFEKLCKNVATKINTGGPRVMTLMEPAHYDRKS